LIEKQYKLSVVTVFLCATLLFFMSFSLQGVCLQEQDNSGEPLVTINGEIITLEKFEQFWNMIPDNYKVELNKEDILDQLITQTLLIQKADELNLREDPEIAFQVKNTVDQILIQALLEREIIEETNLSDEEIELYYEENKENYWQEEEIHALDILVETEEEAENILKKLEEGEDFSKLAEDASIASSASEGGDIGFISKGTLRSEIEDQLFILNPGEISEIIPVENGFHIFKVLEKKPSGYIELEEVKEEIEYQLLPVKQQENFDKYLKEIEDNAIIEKNIELLKNEEN
jgi:parvulin-like peptidyl-prolyl isomerase